MIFKTTMAVLLGAVLTAPAAWAAGGPPSPEPPFKLLFSSPQDLVETWGKLDIVVTPVRLIREVPTTPLNNGVWPAQDAPGTKLVGCFPLADGSWEVFSQQWVPLAPAKAWHDNPSTWKLMRAVTTDGATFKQVETVIEETTGPWTRHLVMAYNPEAKEYLMLKLRNDSHGFAYHAFFSPDGKKWQAHPDNPLFYEGDAVTVFWSAALKRFVVVSKSFLPWRKHIRDHGPPTKSLGDDTLRDRRVLMIRSSPDGRRWEPSASLQDLYDIEKKKTSHPPEQLTVPDADDPPDLEFYNGNGFWYYDRAYMMVLNYAPHPLMPGKHGEEVDDEWWTSADGLKWERPARGLNALEEFRVGLKRFEMPPMIIGGKLLWLEGPRLLGLPEDRISGVSVRANGEFSTKPFTMPPADLLLNAAVPAKERPWVARTPQPYLMVAVLDDQGKVIAGFDREKCLIWNNRSGSKGACVDRSDIPLMWGSASARQLAGRTIRLRFFFGGSTIYAVTAKPQPQ